jgi:ribose transport system ATP-binding protein
VLRDGKFIGVKPAAETNEGELIRMMVGRALELEPLPHLDNPAPTGQVVLRVRNLSRRPLLRDASLEVRAGEIVGLAGLVGSGRSELAQAVFGVAPPESGTIEIDGKPVKITRPEEAIGLGIAYAPEDRQRQGLVIAMTVAENIGLTRIWQLMRGPFLDFQAEEMLARQYIGTLRIKTPSSHQVARNLSGGNQQKIVLGKWLATKPRLLIVDEPTRGIDVGARAEIHRLLDGLARDEKMAILVISSDLPEILRLSDRVCVMREGYLVAEFARRKATQENVLAAAVGQQLNGEKTTASDH